MLRLEDPGGVEPLARGLKARCPTVSGLNAPGPSAMEVRRQAAPFLDGGHGDLLLVLLVLPHGIEPRSSGYRPGALPLSYGRDAGASSRTSNRGSPACRAGALAAKLTKRVGARSRTRTWECRCVGPMPWPLGEASSARRVGVACWMHASGMTARKQEWCTREDLNLHALRRPLLRRLRLPFRHECIAKSY